MTADTRNGRRTRERRRGRKNGGGVGINLIKAVMDCAPESLTWRERWVLTVLAEDANDTTRETWVGYEGDDPKSRLFRARTHCSRSQYYATLKSLIEKKAIEPTRRGQKGVTAHYRVLPTLLQRPEGWDAEGGPQRPRNRDPDSGLQGPGKPDAEASAQGPGSETSGSRFGSFSVPETGTPSPQSPQDPSSSSRERALIRAAAVVPEEEEEEFHAWILKAYEPRSPRWWAKIDKQRDFPSLAERWRAQRTPMPPRMGSASRPQSGLSECTECRSPVRGALAAGGLCPRCWDDADQDAQERLAGLDRIVGSALLDAAKEYLEANGWRPTPAAQNVLAAELMDAEDVPRRAAQVLTQWDRRRAEAESETRGGPSS